MLYEMTTLTLPLGAAGRVNDALAHYLASPDTAGTFLGCWHTEIGTLNECLVLRSYSDMDTLRSERQRIQGSTNPFSCGEHIAGMTFESYEAFPFLPPVKPGKYGSVYEIRTYRLKQGGVPHTIEAWKAAMPERSRYSPLTMAMYSIEGPPRFTHIWPYESLDARARIRAETVAKGAWPPKGGPNWLTGDMRSTIGLPAPFSPLA